MTGNRVRSDFFVGALRRRAEAAGAFVSIARRGAEEAGAIFIVVDRRDGRCDLYAPAPQSVFEDERPEQRLFSLVLDGVPEADARTRMEQELRFDPDLWLIDMEDRDGRAFVDIAPEIGKDGFTIR